MTGHLPPEVAAALMRGRMRLIFVTFVMLWPVYALLWAWSNQHLSALLPECVCGLVALVLTFTLWTGTPLFRWVAACFLLLLGGYGLLVFLLSPLPASYALGAFAAASVLCGATLLLSRSTKSYLSYREARRLNLSLGGWYGYRS